MDQPVPRVELAFRPKESFAAPGSNIRKPEDQVDMTAENTELHATQHKAQAPIGGRKHTRPAAGPLKSSSKQEAPEQKEPVAHEWSDVPGPLHEAVIACLKRVCHDVNTLARSGYKVREMTQEDVKGYAKCRNCGGLRPPRRVVALDCEMVEVKGGDSEVAQVCAVDTLTGEVIVDIYVVPSKTVTDWRTPWSGVSQRLLEEMKEAGKTVNGWEEARKALWAHIDADTILVGQSLQHDLDVMRMVHLNIIDTAILSREAVAKNCKQNWGLKRLCKQMLDRDIQQSRGGHDCLEDTMATREVVLWCVRHPGKFQEWAVSQREWKKKADAHWKLKRKESDKAQVKQPQKSVSQVPPE
ncbi:hypothetical protein KXV48_002462 [Aspergillus fumigatus]|nr:hypothetical protein KXV48_002462 [Aspergillus fumigatus]